MANVKVLDGTAGRRTITELDEAGNVIATYVNSVGGTAGEATERVDIVWPSRANSKSLARSVLDVFLPSGYPGSVTEDYLWYQVYDSLQAFASSIASLLSSRAVLEGVGVGNASATPTNALYLSIVQESVGRIATIFFAYRFGTAIEPDCKMYRLMADFFNDAAIILDCLSPAFPQGLRVGILGASSSLRALCGVAAGSAKGCLSAHFARAGNLGELNAKDSSQETVISLLGMLVGSLVVSRIVSPLATWSALVLLLSIHLLMNYAAVRSVSMRSLNQQRANIVISTLANDQRVLTPGDVSQRERIFTRSGMLIWQERLVLGSCAVGGSMQGLLRKLGGQKHVNSASSFNTSVSEILEVFEKEKYILWFDTTDLHGIIIFKQGSQSKDQLKAWCHALILARQVYDGADMEKVTLRLQATRDVASQLLTRYTDQLEASGWQLDITAIETQPGNRITY